MLDQQKGKEKELVKLFTFIFPLFLFCIVSISQHFYLLQVCSSRFSFRVKKIGQKMYTIPENAPTETDSILSIKENDPISQMLHSASSTVSEGSSANSISKTSAFKDAHVRRNSTGNIGIPYRSVKILSRYLATTRSSCHDQCKFGITQDFDVNKLRSRTLKTFAEKHTRGHYMGKTDTALEEGKKKSALSFPPSGSRSHKPDSPVSTRRSEISSPRKENSYQQFSLPLQGLAPRSKPTLSKLSVLSIEDHSESKQFGIDVQDNQLTATPVQNQHGNSKQTTTRNAKEAKTEKLNGKKVSSRTTAPLSSLHSVKKVLTRPIVPKRSAKRYITPKNETLKTLKVVSHLNSDIGKAENHLQKDHKTSKNPKNEISIDQPSPTSTAKTSRRPQNKQAESSTPQEQRNAETAKIKPTRERVARPIKDKDSPARKLNFRKGRVIENQGVTNPSRRLKYKQRSLSDTLVVDVEKIQSNFGSREVQLDGGEMNGKNSESEKVNLKHQDGDEDKKGAQNLLNNMIEERANKLAETKKSKVKVLVGAFESVISLQDSKQATSMVDAC